MTTTRCLFFRRKRMNAAAYKLAELNKESRMGAMGSESTAREVRRIDLSDFEARKAQIADELWNASVEVGFFQIVNHGIPQALVDHAFDTSARFFRLAACRQGAVPAQQSVERGLGKQGAGAPVHRHA
jgi:hypothetical protein